jgi:AAA domain
MSLIKAAPPTHFFLRASENFLQSSPRKRPKFYQDEYGPFSNHDNDFANFRALQILPTADEVLASGIPVYMPMRDLVHPNPIPAGVDRLLDLSFRQLRFENVEKIIDICYAAAQTSFLKHPNSTTHETIQYQQRQETPLGNRYFLYENVQVEELVAHESESVLVRLSFDCPPSMRGRRIFRTGRFEKGMLVALLCLDTQKNELEIHYMQGHLLESTDSMNPRGGHDRKAAVQLSFMPDTTRRTVQQFAKFAQKLCPEVNMCLVEFPKLLHASFCNCLNRLQDLPGFAFSHLIAPASTLEEIQERIIFNKNGWGYLPRNPPKYAEQSGFEFEIRDIARPGIPPQLTGFTLDEICDPSGVAMIRNFTNLDQGQAGALAHSLRSQMAFTQGPPGTGKSYIGIALAQVLLASRPTSSKKPILVVCLTNHALDTFLGGLKDVGVQNLVRIGGGSKEEWTKAISLREKRAKTALGREESSKVHDHKSEAASALAGINSWCQGQSAQELSGEANWFVVESGLLQDHRDVYDQFKGLANSPAMLPFLFSFWAKGGGLQEATILRTSILRSLSNAGHSSSSTQESPEDIERIMDEITSRASLQQSLLGASSIWNLSAAERRSLVEQWAEKFDPSTLAEELGRMYEQHQLLRKRSRQIFDERDVHVLLQADVIGMTTTACARMWDVLNELNLEILICEEAGEVLEPHLLCSLLPTIQHSIFIGDPQQLRPEVSEFVLSLEASADYRLDESLFQKMTLPLDLSLYLLPMAQLNIQRRMHPEIAQLSRVTYPFLRDHPSTFSHPHPSGLVRRLFWWDHRVPEVAETTITKSHVNQYEVDMVVGLVQYLLKGSAYAQGDIAVITPYSGQLARLHECLKTTCNVWLNHRDREMLLSEEAFEAAGPRSRDEVSASDMVRIATIDNFQGEEAKIVIFSAVRSGERAGFLANANRINVACSRARECFYIIGNSETLEQVPMWNRIINIFDDRREFGLMTTCPNHQEHYYTVLRPQDFAALPDCPIPCNIALPCGHMCPENCHALELHQNNIIPCPRRCEIVLECGHQCHKKCGEICGPCTMHDSGPIPLSCGHTGYKLCSGADWKCSESLGQILLSCGHSLETVCGQPVPTCKEACSSKLPCGHACHGKCFDCAGNGHPKCVKVCGKPLVCNHACQAHCGHGGDICPSCQQDTSISCEHGVRMGTCSEPAKPCLKPQGGASALDKGPPCCFPSTDLPPSDLCIKLLPCGHVCSALASEICIPSSLCPACLAAGGPPPSTLVPQVFIRECGHLVDLIELDKINLQGVYKVSEGWKIIGFESAEPSKVKPATCICRTPCPSVHRYEQLQKFEHLSQTIDMLVAGEYCQLESFSNAAEMQERDLQSDFEFFKTGLREGPLAGTTNHRLVMGRKEMSRKSVAAIATYRGMCKRSSSHITD